MKIKIFRILICMMLLMASATIIPHDIKVKASRGYGDPEIDYGYIFNITKEMSDIPFDNDAYWYKSRYIGTPGE